MCKKAMEIDPNVPSTYQIHIENFRITMLNNFSKVLDVLMGVKNI